MSTRVSGAALSLNEADLTNIYYQHARAIWPWHGSAEERKYTALLAQILTKKTQLKTGERLHSVYVYIVVCLFVCLLPLATLSAPQHNEVEHTYADNTVSDSSFCTSFSVSFSS